MTDLSRDQPTERFTGMADLYARCRPDYPDAAVDLILARCRLGPGSLLVDVGCGTGISARIFARRGIRVIGIEPNADMRRRAEDESLPADVPVPWYRDGQAEATGLPATSADAVLAAQAFHWFRADDALREFHRIVRPGGGVALIWNERDESDPFTAAYGNVIHALPEAPAVEGPRRQVGEVLLTCPLFHDAGKFLFSHEQTVDEDGLVGRALSVSYAPRSPDQIRPFASAVRAVFARFQHDGRVTIRYETTVYLAHRPAR